MAELEQLVEMLLLGWVDPKTGEHLYFESGSRGERAARHAVAHLMENAAVIIGVASRGAEPTDWLQRLASLFDPGNVFARDVMFGFHREGAPSEILRHRRIAGEMRQKVRADRRARGSVARAVKAAAEMHGLDERQVRRIWVRYGKPMMT